MYIVKFRQTSVIHNTFGCSLGLYTISASSDFSSDRQEMRAVSKDICLNLQLLCGARIQCPGIAGLIKTYNNSAWTRLISVIIVRVGMKSQSSLQLSVQVVVVVVLLFTANDTMMKQYNIIQKILLEATREAIWLIGLFVS